MRKFLAVLMAVFMLTATLAVLPASAAAITTSDKDGSTAADADAMNLVITEVLANTQANNVGLLSHDAYQYIEIYNRGTTPVNLYDYAIVRAAYNQNSGDPWPAPKKFTGKVVLDAGSIYAYYQENNTPNIDTYAKDTATYGCNNPAEGTLAPGEVALIWFWNAHTKEVFAKNGGTTGEKSGDFTTFRKHYKDITGVEIPTSTKIFATFGVDGIGTSFNLNNARNNYIYALVDDTADFNIGTEVAYNKTAGGNFEQNAKVLAMFKHGTSLGWYSPAENKSVTYTLANKTPVYANAYYESSDNNYYERGDVDSFKEMACVWYEEDITPGKLLPIQWADIDPNRAPADVKGSDANWATTVWTTYSNALVAANGGGESTGRPEEDKKQDEIDVDRDDLGNQGQNKAGEWTFVTWVDEATGGTKYGRYKTEGGSMDTVVEISKEYYDIAMKALAEQDEEDSGLGLVAWLLIGGAALVVLAAAAVVVIILLKKKNKNVAADDVAGDVQIIDDEGNSAE